MSDPFLGEIRMFGFNFAPQGWAFCDGQLLSIAQNDALFTLIGTTYGGDGEETFALPNLQSRVPIHQGTGPSGTTYLLGENGGVEQVTLTVQQIPIHAHAAVANSQGGNSSIPDGNFWAANANTAAPQFTGGANVNTNMNLQTVSPVGGSQPHDNMLPYLAIEFCIALEGIFPPQ